MNSTLGIVMIIICLLLAIITCALTLKTRQKDKQLNPQNFNFYKHKENEISKFKA
jgi:hypothetical protein